MRALHESVVRVISGAFGLVCGVLSAIVIGAITIVGPVLGLLAILVAPVRAIIDRFRDRSVPTQPESNT